MRILISLFIFTSLPMVAPAIDIDKFGFTLGRGRYWNTSSLKDAYRLYTFRKDIDRNRRESRWLNTYGIAYGHVTKGGTLVQLSISFGNYHVNENPKIGIAGNLLISQYNFQTVQRYVSISAFQSFGKEQNFSLKSANAGLLFRVWERTKGKSIHAIRMGVGFSMLYVDGNIMPGINLKANSWRL